MHVYLEEGNEMKEDHEHYQEAKIIFQIGPLAIQKAMDGSGAIWFVWRLFAGKEDKRVFKNLEGEITK